MARLLRLFLLLFGIGFLLNGVWEVSQMPLYDVSMSPLEHAPLCLRAALWDAGYLVTAYLLIAAVYRDFFWIHRRHGGTYLLISFLGFVVATLVEVHALRTGQWSYTVRMPLVPVVRIGVTPFLQLVLTSLLTYEVVRAYLPPPEHHSLLARRHAPNHRYL